MVEIGDISVSVPQGYPWTVFVGAGAGLGAAVAGDGTWHVAFP